MEYINSLPQPFRVRFVGDAWVWPVIDFEVETGLMRFDVCGIPQARSLSEAAEIIDGDNMTHDPDTFYTDYEPTP
jgi:hypothetical protein